MSRLTLRTAFLEPERRPVVHFYTTSTEKFLQARHVFERSGLALKLFKSKRDPYSENEEGTAEELLTQAVAEIRQSLGQSSLFFVEDTSVSIEALRSGDQEAPGLGVKEWFANTPFDDLDAQLRRRENDRRAIVRSNIALHVPGLSRPVFVSGETHGRVAESPPTFDPNPQYPWLTPNTFNGWFIPEGTARRLGEMSLEESLIHDFRAHSLRALIDRLEEYAVVLNLPSHAYIRRPRPLSPDQPALFAPEAPGFIVVGPTCAGKTTFAQRATEEHLLRHIEASDVVRSLDALRSGESPAAFAERVLSKHGADIVARRILELHGVDLEEGFVISGFRTIQELLTFTEAVPRTKVVRVEAVDRIRFERYLARGRTEDVSTLDEFRRLDAVQGRFGLLPVSGQLLDLRVTNESELTRYLDVVDAVVAGRPVAEIPGVSGHPKREDALTRSQLLRCLTVLERAGRPLSTDEIETLSAESGTRIRHNNANKVLKRHPELARRLEGGTSRLRYELVEAGLAYLRYVDRTGDRRSHTTDGSPDAAITHAEAD